MSNFKKVYQLNRIFQKPVTGKTAFSSIEYNIIKKQVELIEEELAELKAAVRKKDWEGIKDATGDILVTTYGMGYAGQFDCDVLMNNIDASNLSKLCDTYEIAEATKDYYQRLGVETVIDETVIVHTRLWLFKVKQTKWFVKSAKQQTYTEDGVVKSINAGKFLKSINWTSPNLDVDYPTLHNE